VQTAMMPGWEALARRELQLVYENERRAQIGYVVNQKKVG
jgi:hypothetical protein